MINKTKKDVINDIVSVINPLFEAKGFTFKKNYFEFIDDSGNIYQYEINLSKKQGYFSLHLRLQLLNKSLMKEVNIILEKVLRDVSYIYPDNWDKKTIEYTINTRIKNYCVSMLTDWRCFKDENESLKLFRDRFSIWMCVFDDINEIKDWQKQLIESVYFSLDWFSSIGSEEWIVENTLYPALLILKKRKEEDKLNEKYENVLSKVRLKDEASSFFEFLNIMYK